MRQLGVKPEALEAAIEALERDSRAYVGIDGFRVSWTCREGHSGSTIIYDILRGIGCVRCKRKGRQPRKPNVAAPGDRSGDLEVVQYLGVKNGHSFVLVKNVTNNLTAEMRLGDFKRQKSKLLCPKGIAAVLKKNGDAAKGRRNVKNSKYSVGDLRAKLKLIEIELLNQEPDENPMHDSLSRDIWKAKCRCGREFGLRPNSVLCGQVTSCGCGKAGAQLALRDVVETWTKTETNARKLIPGYEVDIWAPEHKIAIEYNGLYWHNSDFVGSRYHHDKWMAAKALGIRLITVFEDEWLFRKDVVEAYLKSIISKPDIKVMARKTQIRALTLAEISRFLETNHIQGRTNSGQFNAGLFYNDELVAAMSCRFARGRHKGVKIPFWELTRYCVKSGYLITGGFQKLFKSFLDLHDPESVVSFSDNRWSAGYLYERQGFVKVADVEPSYSYFNKHDRVRFHKSKFQKQKMAAKLGPLLPDETEKEAAKRFGFLQIWDCGLTKWEFRPNRKGRSDLPFLQSYQEVTPIAELA